jgi:hypothetical protein
VEETRVPGENNRSVASHGPTLSHNVDNDNKGKNKITELRTILQIRVITKLPNSEQPYKGKVKTHKYINRQNQSTTGKL